MTEIGAWRLLELRSGGAFGHVYKAESLQQPGAGPFALKLSLRSMDPRFLREAELLRRIRHPHVPRLYDSGFWEHPSGPFPYLVMEWLEGQSLYAWARGRELSSRQMMRVLAPLAWALAATHSADAVHRDVKGDNVLVRLEDAYPMLLDFGAGDFRGAPTLTHEVLPPGTPGYRSPEALRFQERFWRAPGARYEPGPADDLYALGVTAYRLVTGFYPPPWIPAEVRRLEPSFPTLASEPPEKWVTVCPELAEIIRQLLSEDPSERGSAVEVAEALEERIEVAGRKADDPVTGRPSAPPVVRKSRAGASRPAGAWQPWVATAAGFTATAGLATVLVLHSEWNDGRQPAALPQEDLARPEREATREDAGTSLAEDVLTLNARAEQLEPTWEGLRVQIPKQPLPGQARPPCKQRDAIELNGGCWWRPVTAPPCGEGEYEKQGRCYRPILGPPSPATSEPR